MPYLGEVVGRWVGGWVGKRAFVVDVCWEDPARVLGVLGAVALQAVGSAAARTGTGRFKRKCAASSPRQSWTNTPSGVVRACGHNGHARRRHLLVTVSAAAAEDPEALVWVAAVQDSLAAGDALPTRVTLALARSRLTEAVAGALGCERLTCQLQLQRRRRLKVSRGEDFACRELTTAASSRLPGEMKNPHRHLCRTWRLAPRAPVCSCAS